MAWCAYCPAICKWLFQLVLAMRLSVCGICLTGREHVIDNDWIEREGIRQESDGW